MTLNNSKNLSLFLKKNYVIWITGLSGSGKTTVATELFSQLRGFSNNVILLDGDELRTAMQIDYNDHTNFTRESRIKLAHKYSNLAKLLSSQGFTVIVATISMFNEIYAYNKKTIKNYFEIYLEVPLEILKKRNSKHIYSNYDKNMNKNVAGLDSKVDIPYDCDLVIDNNDNEISTINIVNKILNKIGDKNC